MVVSGRNMGHEVVAASEGYRDSLINKVAIWEHPVLTLYFWGFTLIVFVLGTRLFKKLQVHFADVL